MKNKSTRQLMTLCLISKEDKILLGMKKRGKGEGFWNGFGGKVEKDEKIIEAAKRELWEEVGIKPTYLNKIGELKFTHTFDDEIVEVIVFDVEGFEGVPKESEEMMPQWFSLDKIPYDKMWPADKLWLEYYLEGKKFKGKFLFNKNLKLQSYKIEDVKKI